MHDKAKRVIGIEYIKDAVENAKENAIKNKIDNVSFVQGDAAEIFNKMNTKADTLIVDPPRTGLKEKMIRSILHSNVKTLIYISCNPKTMAENLRYLDYYGYKCKYLKPFDNFPMTKHTECIALLEKE